MRRRGPYPSEIQLGEGKAGQFADSLITAPQIRTISKERLGPAIGEVDDPQLQEAVSEAIREHLDLV